MARPSVADERRVQILEATLNTIAEHGIAKASLDRIADTAGMSRGHIRHFVGNRDDLLVDTARYFYSEAAEFSELGLMAPDTATLKDAIDYFLGGPFTESDDEDAIVLGLAVLARTNPRIAAVLAEAYSNTRNRLRNLVKQAYPHADEESTEWAAATLLATFMGHAFINDFERDPARGPQVRFAVERLLATLG